ncbi:MAG: prepilin-type N-terminal cleavage/methylation domain-containing protein [Verrucomicrobiaceae bacterium]|nr:prepilin-type N-terminal cleavage/methylation domain-containing protein [Verrucomicrobiaceae bacterium]
MRLTPPTHSRKGGFTLLEITIVLIIASMIVGMGSVVVGSLFQDHSVNKAVTAIEVLGLESVKRASTRRMHQAILFHEDRCELWDAREGLIRTVALPGGSALLMKRYFSKDFTVAAGQRLDIIPGCLMEPVQLVLKTGGDEFAFALDPLTGGYNPDL